MGAIPCPEEGCNKVFSSRQALQYHLDKRVCKKPELVSKCGKEFTRRYRFNEHMARCPLCKETPAVRCQVAGDVNNGDSNVAGDVINADNVNTINGDVNTLNNGTINNVTNNTVINGFTATDLELVAQEIMKNPGMLQLAKEMSCIHEHLTALTHFLGALENRNVVSGDMKTSTIKVLDAHGNINKSDRHEVVGRIFDNNRRISIKPGVAEFVQDELMERAFDPADAKRDKRKIALTVENKGRYPKLDAVMAAVPNPPVVERKAVMQAMLKLVEQEPEFFPPCGVVQLIASLLTVVVQPYGKSGHRQWLKMDEGWRIVTKAEFEDHVFNQTDEIMTDFTELCWARYERDALPKLTARMVSNKQYDMGHAVKMEVEKMFK